MVSTSLNDWNIVSYPQMGETPKEFKLKNGPTDGISAVKFGPNSSQFLLVSSWDSTVRLYDVISNNMRMQYNHPVPVLDCAFHVRLKLPITTLFNNEIFDSIVL